MRYKNFYSELGKLLYAVAMADGEISKSEAEAIHKAVKDELVPQESHTDEFGTDAAHFTEIEFEIMDQTMADPEEAFNSFISYVEEHHTAFDDRLKTITLDVARKVANSYRGINRDEAAILDKLHTKLVKL